MVWKLILAFSFLTAACFGQIGIVGNTVDCGQALNPMTVTYSPTAGNTIVISYQIGDNVTFTSVTDSKSDSYANFTNSPTLASAQAIYVGGAIAMNVTGGSTTFNVNLSGAGENWGCLNLVELSNVGGVDGAPAAVDIPNTGAINTLWPGTYYTTHYAKTIVIGGLGSNTGEISNGSGVGCNVTGWTCINQGDPGLAFIYQLETAVGTYAAEGASTAANDELSIIDWVLYAAGQSPAPVNGTVNGDGIPPTYSTQWGAHYLRAPSTPNYTSNLIGGGGGGGSPAFVQGKSCNNGSTATTITCTLTGVVAGDLLVAGCNLYIGGLTGTPTSAFTSSGDTWSTDVSYQIVANSNRGICLAHAISSSGGTEAVTMTESQSFGGGASETFFLLEYSVGGITGAIDKTSSLLNGSGTSWNSGATATTTQPTELVVGACNIAASETWTAGSGYTIRETDTLASPGAIEDKSVSSTGAQTATLTGTTSGAGPCDVATYK
jgi:hypothetical protein